MGTSDRNWLVRTRARQILGPYNQAELYEQLRQNGFSPEDEISASGKPWISAQTLLNHDFDEVTRTSIPQTTKTVKISDPELTLTPSPSTYTPTPSITQTPVEILHEEKAVSAREVSQVRWAQQERINSPEAFKPHVKTSHKRAPVLTAVFLLVLIGFFVQMNSRRKNIPAPSPLATKLGSSSETPFIRNVYDLIAKNETSKALEELTKYHQTNPQDLDYLIPYAALLIHENQSHDQARSNLDKVLTSSVGNSIKAKAHLWYGYSLLANEEDDFGEAHFLEALQLNPNDPAARFNLGRTYIKQQKYAHALDYLQLAEVEVPDLWLIHIYKGRAKVALGKLDEARASFRLAIESSPDRWLSYVYYSMFLLGSKDLNEARLTLRKMLTRDPLFEYFSPPPWGFYQEEIDYQEYLSAYTKVMAQAKPEELELGKVFISFFLNGNGPIENSRLQTLAEKGSLMARVLALSTLLRSEPKSEELRRSLVRLG
ncbi:MAG: tetratricopeptide repeat protein, partial [Proteobacteria bacterium]|nr:tetratricopeptide repeat protein [Pseudomonadota bacterium]